MRPALTVIGRPGCPHLHSGVGLPLRFPGAPAAYRGLAQVTDTGLLAQACARAAAQPRCAGEAFDITSGDLCRREHLWPRIAACFGMEAGPPQPLKLAEFMADKGPVWDDLVRRHGLRPYRYEQVASWAFGDFVLNCE